MSETKPYISVVIPTYNEAIRKNDMMAHLSSIEKYFNERKLTYELIIVLDGPTDNTPEFVAQYQNTNQNVRVIKRLQNKGKGYSVREGLLAAKGDFILFTDMDGATPIRMLDNFLKYFNQGYDIVIGSREIDKQEYIKKHQPKWKELLGDFGNILIQITLGLYGIKDTQCGFKAFTNDAVQDIIPRTTVDRWGIDFEILVIGKRLGYKIIDIPVEWSDSGDSLVGIKGYINTLKDLFATKWKLITGRYQLKQRKK